MSRGARLASSACAQYRKRFKQEPTPLLLLKWAAGYRETAEALVRMATDEKPAEMKRQKTGPAKNPPPERLEDARHVARKTGLPVEDALDALNSGRSVDDLLGLSDDER